MPHVDFSILAVIQLLNSVSSRPYKEDDLIVDAVSITIVQSYTKKYHEFVAVCIGTSVQHK